MKHIQSISLHSNTREENLPDFSPDFPYIATQAELDRYAVPWHWHPAAELFYMESGILEYTTPNGKWTFSAGSGGFVNPNVLHCSKVIPSPDAAIQRLHIFDPVLISGSHGNQIDTAYILPFTASSLEILPFFPNNSQHIPILAQIRQMFSITKDVFGYELQIREKLTSIWLQMLSLAQPSAKTGHHADQQIKAIMIYIHEHYSENISVQQLADSVHISKRTCFRLFQDHLHTSPVEYIRNYRLQIACRLLTDTNMSITQIGYACGLGSGSYFGKQFQDAFDCTPAQYRKMARS